MSAAAKNPFAPLETESRRHRPVREARGALPSAAALALVERPEAHDDAAEAAALVAILADALERIAATSTDATSRALAADAMAEFHGR